MVVTALFPIDDSCLRVVPHPVRAHDVPGAKVLLAVLAIADAYGIKDVVGHSARFQHALFDKVAEPVIDLWPWNAQRVALVKIGSNAIFGKRHLFDQDRKSKFARDVVRNCTEIRDEVEAPAPQAFLHTRGDALDAAPKRIQWAIYVSCSGRGGPPFGGTSAELKLAQHALGKVPLAGFFAAGEIARQHLYYQTGVLTAFTGA